MRQLTLNLSEEAYQRLFSEAEEKKQPVEKLAIERIVQKNDLIDKKYLTFSL